MADISIYGTLVNDTGEPIARADQIADPRTGKLLTEILDELPKGGGTGGECPTLRELTAEEIREIANNINP